MVDQDALFHKPDKICIQDEGRSQFSRGITKHIQKYQFSCNWCLLVFVPYVRVQNIQWQKAATVNVVTFILKACRTLDAWLA